MHPDRFIREREVNQLTGLSRTTRWRLERQGKFPSRRRLSSNAVGWLESEIRGWIATREKSLVAPQDPLLCAAVVQQRHSQQRRRSMAENFNAGTDAMCADPAISVFGDSRATDEINEAPP
jgi:prophage regulatory protein